MDKLMPGFDGEIAKMAQRVLVNPRHIDWHTGVLATKVTPGTHNIQAVNHNSMCKEALCSNSTSAVCCVGITVRSRPGFWVMQGCQV